MSLFNLGGSKSRSSSQSQSYGYSGSVSSDISRSLQESLAGGQSSTTQGIAFSDIFSQLYGGASNAANRASLEAPMLADTARQLFTGGSKFLEGLGGDAGTDYLTSRIDGSNPVLDEQIGSLREDVGRLFSEQLNPAITSRAVASGTLGGGRQGVAQGLALDASAREFTRGATELRAQDLAARDQAAAQVAQNSLESANTGLGALPMLLDLQQQGVGSELGVFSNLASILGGPTVLSQSQSTDFSKSTAQSFADAFSRAFGEQTSSSSSKSKSASFDIGFG